MALPLGTEWLQLDRQRLPARPSLGLLTQPISFIGLPVCSVPVWGCHPKLPIGVQLIAAPWREDLVLRVAHHLQNQGIARAPVAAIPAAWAAEGAAGPRPGTPAAGTPP